MRAFPLTNCKPRWCGSDGRATSTAAAAAGSHKQQRCAAEWETERARSLRVRRQEPALLVYNGSRGENADKIFPRLHRHNPVDEPVGVSARREPGYHHDARVFLRA